MAATVLQWWSTNPFGVVDHPGGHVRRAGKPVKFSIVVDAVQHRRLQDIADAEQTSVATIVRKAIRQLLAGTRLADEHTTEPVEVAV